MAEHHCVFDSHYGLVRAGKKNHSNGRNLALMCRCGKWGMHSFGEWGTVPADLLPSACRTPTWFQKLFWALGKNAFGIAIIAVMALFLWLV